MWHIQVQFTQAAAFNITKSYLFCTPDLQSFGVWKYIAPTINAKNAKVATYKSDAHEEHMHECTDK